MARSWEAEYIEYYQVRGPVLRRTAYLLGGSWDDAEDLVQATFVKLYLHWNRIRTETLDGYARRVLVNEFLAGRRRRRETPMAQLHDRPAPGAPPDDRLMLDQALAGLPPRQRAAVVLRYWGDLSVAETAAALGVSIGTVKSTVSRALATLRPLLTGELLAAPPPPAGLEPAGLAPGAAQPLGHTPPALPSPAPKSRALTSRALTSRALTSRALTPRVLGVGTSATEGR